MLVVIFKAAIAAFMRTVLVANRREMTTEKTCCKLDKRDGDLNLIRGD